MSISMADAAILLGSVLMAYDVYCYVRFARRLSSRQVSTQDNRYMPLLITLLALFFLGYIGVGLFGNPDMLMAGILFGGAVFVYVMYRLTDAITQQVLESKELMVQLQVAQESNKAKEDFLASMSHEMRTPLNVILGQNDLALRDDDLSSETRSHLEKVGHSGRYLLGLINNILDLNNMEDGQVLLHSEPFSLGELWSQVDAIMVVLCDEKGLSYEASIGECATRSYVGDVSVLRQVMTCLLDNAVEYTEAPGSVKVTADVMHRTDGGMELCCSVADTGVGMSPEYLEKLFVPFSKEDASSTTRHSGSGLGLAVVKSRLEQLGGTIDVVSEQGKGSTFTFVVPLEEIPQPDGAGEDAAADEMDQQACEEFLAGKRILVVEDVEENAEIACDLLELVDAQSEWAVNGQVALDMFDASSDYYYDAVLMDLRMPVMDGLESTRRIRALARPDARGIPIVALTANAFDVDVQQSLEAGMNEHLTKPVDADQLYMSLARRIDQSQRVRTEGVS